MRGDLAAGIGHVRNRPRLGLLLISFIFVVMIGFPHLTILPALLENELGRPARDVGIMAGASALGGLVAGIALAGLVGSRWAWPLMIGMGALFGGSLMLLMLAPSFLLVGVVMTLAGVGL